MISNLIVEIHNRTDLPLQAIKDGQHYPIPPGRSHMRADVVPFAKNQNPVPGSDDGVTFESLVSVVAKDPSNQQDPLDELPDEILALMPKERLDRSQLGPALQDIKTLDFAKLRRSQVSVERVTDGMTDGSAMADK